MSLGEQPGQATHERHAGIASCANRANTWDVQPVSTFSNCRYSFMNNRNKLSFCLLVIFIYWNVDFIRLWFKGQGIVYSQSQITEQK